MSGEDQMRVSMLHQVKTRRSNALPVSDGGVRLIEARMKKGNVILICLKQFLGEKKGREALTEEMNVEKLRYLRMYGSL